MLVLIRKVLRRKDVGGVGVDREREPHSQVHLRQPEEVHLEEAVGSQFVISLGKIPYPVDVLLCDVQEGILERAADATELVHCLREC